MNEADIKRISKIYDYTNIIMQTVQRIRMYDLWGTVITDIPMLNEFCKKQLEK